MSLHPDHVLIPSGCRKSASAPFWRENALPSVFLKATAIRTASQFYAVFLSRASCHLTCFQEWLFKIYFIGYAVNSCPIFPPSLPSTLHTHPPTFPLFSSCPLVIHVSSLTSTFPILFLTSPWLFSKHIFCTFSPLSPSHSPAENPPCDFHFSDSVPVLVVCLVWFFF